MTRKEHKEICSHCGRGKQVSKHWQTPRCVCCDVHEANCRHKRTPPVTLDTATWPLLDLQTGEVRRMTVREQLEGRPPGPLRGSGGTSTKPGDEYKAQGNESNERK